jgi:hypothetical protein
MSSPAFARISLIGEAAVKPPTGEMRKVRKIFVMGNSVWENLLAAAGAI